MIVDDEPASTTGKFDNLFWWACINRYSSAAGMQTLVKAGEVVEWSRATHGKCPKDWSMPASADMLRFQK